MTLFNQINIPEPFDLSNLHSHRCVIYHFKCTSSSGCWMIMIVFRTDGDWKAGGWIFKYNLALLSQHHKPKQIVEITYNPIQNNKIARIKSAHLQPDQLFLASHVRHAPNMPETFDTSDSDTNNPSTPDADVSSFTSSGIGWLTTDASQLTLSSVDHLLLYEWRSWYTDTRFDGSALMGERSVKFFISWLPDWSINRDTDIYWQAKIDGNGDRWCLFKT